MFDLNGFNSSFAHFIFEIKSDLMVVIMGDCGDWIKFVMSR